MILSIFFGYWVIGLLVAWKLSIWEILEGEDPELSSLEAVYDIPIVRTIIGIIYITICILLWPIKVFIWMTHSMKHGG